MSAGATARRHCHLGGGPHKASEVVKRMSDFVFVLFPARAAESGGDDPVDGAKSMPAQGPSTEEERTPVVECVQVL